MDAELSPSNGEYTGRTIDHLGNAVYLRLMTPLGSWWADPRLGSRLHELSREKDLPQARRLAVAYAEQALSPLLEDGRAAAVTVSAAPTPTAGQMSLRITVVHAAGGRVQNYNHVIKVG